MKSVGFAIVVLLLWHRANTSEIICNKPDLNNEEVVNIPGDGNEFPETFTCLYEFGSTDGETSKLEIPLLDISCDTGYVKFGFDEQNLEDSEKKFCDGDRPETFSYNGASVYMKVVLMKKSPGNKMSYHFTKVASMENFLCQAKGEFGTTEKIPSEDHILPDDFECKYTFRGTNEEHIKLEIKKFYIEESPNCVERYVEIGVLVDGKATPGRRFCGSVIPNEIVIPSQNAYMKVWLGSRRAGEVIQYTATEVTAITEYGPTKNVREGTLQEISIPGLSKFIPNDFEYYSKWIAAHGKQIKLTFSEFNIVDNVKCMERYVEISMGDGTSAEPGRKFCGPNKPQYAVYGKELYVKIKLGKQRVAENIIFKTEEVPSVTEIVCPTEDLAANGDTVELLGDSKRFTFAVQCTYVVTAAMGKHIRLEFSHFDIEDNVGCIDRYLEIGVGVGKSQKGGRKYCGSQQPKVIIYPASKIYLKVNLQTPRASEKISFTANEVGPLNALQIAKNENIPIGTLKQLPGDAFYFPSTNASSYVVQVADGKNIRLKFFEFDLEKSPDCGKSSLELQYGDTRSETNTRTFCGSKLPNPIMIPANKVYIHLKFGAADRVQFVASEIPVPTSQDCLSVHDLATKRFNIHLNKLTPEKELSCKHEFRASSEKHIKLTFHTFNLINDGCVRNVELISEIQGTLSPVRKFCGHMEPKEEIYPFEKGSMQLNLNPMKIGETIRITISEVEQAATFVCVSNIEMEKMVQIPGPQEYLTKDFTCTYQISVAMDKKIRITFPEFDVIGNMDFSTGCVRFTNDASEEVFRKFCGKMVPKEVIIPTNSFNIEVKFPGEYPASRLSFVASEVNLIEESCPVSPLNANGLLANIPSKGKYLPRDFQCTYVIGSDGGPHIKMEFQTIDIKDLDNCATRYIRIEDNGTKHCGNVVPLEMLPKKSKISMSVELPGLPWADAISFVASEITSKQLASCEGKQGVPLNTSFSKPGDSFIFSDFFECIYEITASNPNNRIKLDFTRFEIECDGRYVQLGTTESDLTTANNQFCGSNRPQTVTFNESKVYVKVKLGDQRDYEGFAFTATEVKIDTDLPFPCVKKVYIATKDIHELKVPAEGQYLPPNFECSYTIDAPKGQNVEIEFVKFRIGEVDHCGENTLLVGKEPVEGLSAHLCGPTLPTHFPNKQPSILLKIKGKSLERDDGFVLKYKSNVTKSHWTIICLLVALALSWVTT